MSDRISHTYRQENETLHEGKGYGSSGHLWLGHILELAEVVNASSLIDYGAGKGTLGKYLSKFGIDYTPYDPATFPKVPTKPADMVVCLDVLEHIEPDKLGAVLDHMHSLTTTLFFANVSTRPATKTLSDGRNAHLIVEDWPWWKQHLHRGGTFKSIRVRQHADHFDFVGMPTHEGRKIARHMIQRIRGKL
jgi:hypothetical protein